MGVQQSPSIDAAPTTGTTGPSEHIAPGATTRPGQGPAAANDATKPASPIMGATDVNRMNISDLEFLKTIQFVRGFSTFVAARNPNGEWLNGAAERYTQVYALSAYSYDAQGRKPTPLEWQQVEALRFGFMSEHSQATLHSYVKTQPLYWIKRLPLWLLLVCLISFAFSVFGFAVGSGSTSTPADWNTAIATLMKLFGYLGWTVSLGALGATAYIAVNLLGLQFDNPFDANDINLVAIRVVVGIVFGFIISITISLPAISQFASAAWDQAVGTGATGKPIDLTTVVQVLLPFVLGFSTSLVLTIMSRLVASVETIFGVARRAGP